MTTETIAQLKKSFLFCGLPEEALQIVAEKISTQDLKKDETLFRKGDVGDALFMIDEGLLNIVTEDAQGSKLLLNQCGPGETIGEMSLFDEEPRSASVVAKTDAHILSLKRDDFFDMLEQNPATANLLIRNIWDVCVLQPPILKKLSSGAGISRKAITHLPCKKSKHLNRHLLMK